MSSSRWKAKHATTTPTPTTTQASVESSTTQRENVAQKPSSAAAGTGKRQSQAAAPHTNVDEKANGVVVAAAKAPNTAGSNDKQKSAAPATNTNQKQKPAAADKVEAGGKKNKAKEQAQQQQQPPAAVPEKHKVADAAAQAKQPQQAQQPAAPSKGNAATPEGSKKQRNKKAKQQVAAAAAPPVATPSPADEAAAKARAAEELAKKQAEAEAKKQRELEAKRLEEERKAAEAAQQLKEEAEKAKRTAKQQYDDTVKFLSERQQLRTANKAAFTQRNAPSAKLDSSIKRCTALRNKIQALPQHSTDAIVNDIKQLQLTKYIEEIVNEMLNLRLTKQSDIIKFTAVASALHQRYEEFITPLIGGFTKQLRDMSAVNKYGQFENAEEQSKRRNAMRLLLECCYVGLTDDCNIIVSSVGQLMARDMDQATDQPLQLDAAHIVLSTVVLFCKNAGEELLGRTPKKLQAVIVLIDDSDYTVNKLKPLRDGVSNSYVTQQQRDSWLKGFDRYFDVITQRLLTVAKAHRRLERVATKQQLLRGEIPTDINNELRVLRESHEKLLQYAQQLGDYLDKEDVRLEDELNAATEIEDSALANVTLASTGGDGDSSGSSMYEDDEQRAFYESLPDLRLVVPPLLLTEGNEKAKAKLRREIAAGEGTPKSAEDTTDAATDDGADDAGDDEQSESKEAEPAELSADMSLDELEKRFTAKSDSDSLTISERKHGEADSSAASQDKQHPIDVLLTDLQTAYNKDAADSIAERFVYLNTKPNRAKLLETLYYVHYSQQDLLPVYARLVAILHPYVPDIGKELVGLLQREFYRLLRSKQEGRVETRQRNIRYLAELTKFRVAAPIVLLSCFQAALVAWSNVSIPVACALLESAGRWMFQNPITHQRTAQLVEQMSKLKQTKYIDRELHLQIDNALYAVNPPTTSIQQVVKQRSPLHQWIRQSLYVQLNSKSTEQILKRFKRLPWQDSDTKLLVVKCFCNVINVGYNNIAALASVASGLDSLYPIGSYIVDTVCEEIRVGLERLHDTQNQRQIMNVKYLGELYAYRLCDTQTIFDTLYLFVTYDNKQSALAPQSSPTSDKDQTQKANTASQQGDTLRIRLMLTLLDVVARYFIHGAIKRRLERFLLYFQRYVFSNPLLPIDIEFSIVDLYSKIHPKHGRYETYAEVNEVIRQLERSEQGNAATKDRLYSVETPQSVLASAASPTSPPVTSPTIAANRHRRTASDGSLNSLGSSAGSDDASVDDEMYDEDEEVNDRGDDQPAESKQRAKMDWADIAEQADAGLDDEVYDDSDEEGDSDEESSSSSDDDEQFQRRRVYDKDDELNTMFDRLMTESVESAKYNRPSGATFGIPDISLATSNSTSSSDSTPSKRSNATQQSNLRIVDRDDTEHVVFRMLTRAHGGGYKPTSQLRASQTRDLYVPLDTDLAITTIHNEQTQRAEKDELKRLVLAGLKREEMNEREAELQRQMGRSAKKDATVDLDFSHRSYDPSVTSGHSSGSSRARQALNKGPKLDLGDIGTAFPEFRKQKKVTYGGAHR